MDIYTAIDSLISYAMNRGLAQPEDHQVLLNRLLDLLRLDDYIPSREPQTEDLEEILRGILDYAVEKGLCDDGITARESQCAGLKPQGPHRLCGAGQSRCPPCCGRIYGRPVGR